MAGTRRPRAAISWSGGKDCCTALHRTWRQYDVIAMITMFDEDGGRSRSHGLRPEVLAAHAERLGLVQIAGRCTWESYEPQFAAALEEAAGLYVSHVIFGDIMFDEHRAWTERMCARAGLAAVQPIWGEPTAAVAREFIDSGAEAIIVTARAEHLGREWLGRRLDGRALQAFEELGVDPCGERGEYHTLVTSSPLFDRSLRVALSNSVLRSGCWAIDVELEAPDGENVAARR